MSFWMLSTLPHLRQMQRWSKKEHQVHGKVLHPGHTRTRHACNRIMPPDASRIEALGYTALLFRFEINAVVLGGVADFVLDRFQVFGAVLGGVAFLVDVAPGGAHVLFG